MDLHQERYLFISGLISLVFFLLLVSIVAYSYYVPMIAEPFSMKQSNVISVSISEMPIESPKGIPDKIEASVKNEPKVTSTKPIESVTSEKAPNISDLFSQVKPQKSIVKPPTDTKRDDVLNALEYELLSKKETPRFSDKIKNIDLVKPSVKMIIQGSSSGPIVNEYHAKIQGLIYMHFHPPVGTVGAVARIKITISANGDLIGYKVLIASNNSTFNSEVDWLKDRLKTFSFPRHPEGKEAVLELILTTKG